MKDFLLTAENIFWIVTVPAIWEDYTKIVYEATVKIRVHLFVYFTC